jgi:hypothetical protein
MLSDSHGCDGLHSQAEKKSSIGGFSNHLVFGRRASLFIGSFAVSFCAFHFCMWPSSGLVRLVAIPVSAMNLLAVVISAAETRAREMGGH